ncbi:hypothetical protein TrVFT333_010724 [Trichoderma virens FT-333]|nr:hypothetical protein TrVFT333_010724 [Trichoderma virens FT-333]
MERTDKHPIFYKRISVDPISFYNVTDVEKCYAGGGWGNLGTHVLQSLIEAKFNVSVMSRASSKAAFPENLRDLFWTGVLALDCLDLT